MNLNMQKKNYHIRNGIIIKIKAGSLSIAFYPILPFFFASIFPIPSIVPFPVSANFRNFFDCLSVRAAATTSPRRTATSAATASTATTTAPIDSSSTASALAVMSLTTSLKASSATKDSGTATSIAVSAASASIAP